MWTDWSVFNTLDIAVPGERRDRHADDRRRRRATRTRSPSASAPSTGCPISGSALRAGFIYDPTPVPSQYLTPQLPDIDRDDVTIGATKELGNIDVSVGLLWVIPRTRATATGDATMPPEYKGTYDVSAFVASLTVGGKFGTGRD